MLEREWGTEENSRRPRGEVVLGEALVGGGASVGTLLQLLHIPL